MHYLFDILNEYGHKDLVYTLATQTTQNSWGDLIARGATSWWEGWNSGSVDHHYYSSINTWFYQGLGGIKPAAPGYRRVTIKPFVPGNVGTSGVPTSVNQTGLPSALVDKVEVSRQTARGTVSNRWWRRDDGRIAMVVKVPANTPTEIWVPTQGKPVDALPSATFVRNDAVGADAYAVYSVTGGDTYLFNLSTSVTGPGSTAGGTVPATLSLALGAPASFGAFTPGVDRSYESTTTANVISTAGDATLSVSDPSANATGRLVNGSFALAEPLQVRANSGAFAPLSTTAGSPLVLLTYNGPISNDSVSLALRQHIGSGQALRTGSHGKTLTSTLSTTAP
jgi:hypothetical protein